MKISERSFIMVTESSGTIIVDDYLEGLLRKEVRPILWCRDGLFCVVPAEILMNVLETIDVFIKAGNSKSYIARLTWGQGYLLPYDVGHILIGI